MRYKCLVAYKGNSYVGFQSQINGLAIQDVIEDKLALVFGEKIRIEMASRTDSKVHAFNQVFHFDTSIDKDPFKLKGNLNGLLPNDIHINNIEIVNDDFHSRYSCIGKCYKYLVNIGEYSPFLEGYAYQCFYRLDIELIKEGLKIFIGKHDFSSFNTTPYAVKQDQVREIYDFNLELKDNLLIFTIKGNGFLRHMVRMIVGSLIDLGRGHKSLEELKEMLDKPNKDTKRYNIDACGLYLYEIYY